MSFGRCQLDMLDGDEKLVQIRIGFWHEVDESRIQTAGPDSLYLLHARGWPKLEFGVRLQLPKPPKGFRDHSSPARILGETDAQCA